MLTPKSFRSKALQSGAKIAIPLPFDPNEVWGPKDHHYVAGTVAGNPVRALLAAKGAQFFLLLGPAWCRDHPLAAGDRVKVVLFPEGPQLDLLAEDIVLALDPQAKAFFASLASFYRKNYIRWIESAKRPETRRARIAEMARLLAAGKKQK